MLMSIMFIWQCCGMQSKTVVFGAEDVETTVDEYSEEKIIENAKTGIVEIMSGFYDPQGNFHKLKSGSGFLIRNTDNETYIVTNRSIVMISDEAKTMYCAEKGIIIDYNLPTTVIKVIVKGDVSVEVEVVAESEEKNFCILNTQNVVSEKNALRLEDSTKLQPEDVIYAMGFPNKENLEYIPEEVECNLGVIKDSELNSQGVLYIQHTAQITDGSIGGPLLNKAGYVVGVNCQVTLENGTVVNCALPIGEIIEVLNNFAISYDSSLRDKWNFELEQLYEECNQLSTSENYKSESITKLQESLELVKKLEEKEKISIEEIEDTYMKLKEAKDALVPKMDTKQLIIYVLAGCIAAAFVWLLILIVLKYVNKKQTANAIGNQQAVREPQTMGQQKDARQSQTMEQSQTMRHITNNVQTQPMYEQRQESYVQQGKTHEIQLLQKRTGNAVPITVERMIVGKSSTKADFSIPDNKMVSREHAVFQQQKGKIYVCDLQSSNGTFVNGKRIPAEKFIEIKVGDEVVFANETFIVQG